MPQSSSAEFGCQPGRCTGIGAESSTPCSIYPRFQESDNRFTWVHIRILDPDPQLGSDPELSHIYSELMCQQHRVEENIHNFLLTDLDPKH